MKSNHVLFDGEKIVISPGMKELLDFLIEIDKEVASLLKAKDQSGEKLIQRSRAELIVIFAQLETMRCLWTAYSNKTKDRKKIRDASDRKIDIFLKNFCLSKKNSWVKNNPKRAGKIGVKNLRDLRNNLTHFFSVPMALAIAPADSEDDIEQIGRKTNNRVKAIMVKDLVEINKGAFEIMIKKWSDDFQRSQDKGDSNFEERIGCVNDLVKNHGAKFMIKNKQERIG
jgi:hypothetical protein